ncbi:hypothetical protein Har1131_20500 [Haloarcula sp. CBA1131]|uniref:hypothetical protein n=1 Tax=Haloarcula TaxID=2237 RepID=UPI0011B61FCB|nr:MULTISPECIES: hypothetical protein [Haloarcula]KAA9401005.1 hypothetical protein Har1131_20500 [Haloarcula sp. CBA1131]
MDIDRADEFRTAAARNLERGNADNLEGVDGLNSGPVDDFVDAGARGNAGDPGNVKGALREVRRADEIGSENIRKMSVELKDGNDIKGELDIQLKSGKIIESKSSFGYKGPKVEGQFEKKLRTMRDHQEIDFDGNTLEVRATCVGKKSMVKSKIKKWEGIVSSSDRWDTAKVTIKVVNENTGTVITS